MTNTHIFESCEFITMLHTMINEQSEQDQVRLNNAYNQFLSRIEQISRSKKSQLDKLRIFTYIYEVLERQKSKLADHTSICYLYAQSASSILSFEKRAILLQLKYPGLNENRKIRRKSPFHLSREYTSTDLMEVIILLHAIGFFRMSDDSPAPLTKLTREFENLCGVKVKNPDNCRWAILNRKTKLTHFVDILRNTLIRLSQK